jgi:hypothetical protein
LLALHSNTLQHTPLAAAGAWGRYQLQQQDLHLQTPSAAAAAMCRQPLLLLPPALLLLPLQQHQLPSLLGPDSCQGAQCCYCHPLALEFLLPPELPLHPAAPAAAAAAAAAVVLCV